MALEPPRRWFREIEDFSERDMRPCHAVYSVYSINLPPDEPSQSGLYDLHVEERARGAHSDPRVSFLSRLTYKR